MTGYKVHFDKIINNDIQSKWAELSKKDLEERRIESKRREQEWFKKSSVVDGIPGRCIVIERTEDLDEYTFIQKLIDIWKTDTNSVLYHYDDIEFLSGTAGYILVKSDGTKLQQVCLMS